MLRRFAQVEIIELPDQPLHNVRSAAEQQAAVQQEGERVLRHLKGYVIACDIKGHKMNSEGFATHIGKLMNRGTSTITLVIGGSLGLSDEMLGRANLRLSFSDMTLPHRLFRIVLLEQLFRACKIQSGEEYHK